ncbi:UNVERIFIED_CONTAM: hypothetical protein FKN15_010434 [Acipenser sinensis]
MIPATFPSRMGPSDLMLGHSSSFQPSAGPQRSRVGSQQLAKQYVPPSHRAQSLATPCVDQAARQTIPATFPPRTWAPATQCGVPASHQTILATFQPRALAPATPCGVPAALQVIPATFQQGPSDTLQGPSSFANDACHIATAHTGPSDPVWGPNSSPTIPATFPPLIRAAATLCDIPVSCQTTPATFPLRTDPSDPCGVPAARQQYLPPSHHAHSPQ